MPLCLVQVQLSLREALHQILLVLQAYCERKRFRGVSRSPWSLTWDSHIPVQAAGDQVSITSILPHAQCQ